MNRSKVLTLAAHAVLSAHAAAHTRTNFDVDLPRLGLTYIEIGDNPDGGGEGKTTVALGQNVDDAQKQQQAEASDTRQVGAAQSDIKDDAGTLGSEGKAAIGDPLAERQSE